MVTYQVTIDQQANESIQNIYTYLVKNASTTVADKVVNGILDTIDSLTTLPNRNAIVEQISTDQVIYRAILKWQYKIIYTIKEKKLQVIVVEIFHNKQNPDKMKV